MYKSNIVRKTHRVDEIKCFCVAGYDKMIDDGVSIPIVPNGTCQNIIPIWKVIIKVYGMSIKVRRVNTIIPVSITTLLFPIPNKMENFELVEILFFK